MKLHWSPRSPFVRKVMIFAHEVGLAGRIEPIRTVVGMSQANRDLLKVNPIGKIPTLITDEGEVLYDSTVICEYLDSLHAGPRYFPQAPRERWRALRWHALGDNMLDNLIFWRNESLRTQVQQSPEILAALEAKIRSSLGFLDAEAAALGKAPIGIGQVGIATALGYLDFRFPGLAWRDGHPGIAAWYETFSQRPSIRNTQLVDDGK
jgi:glutathione S-transferase